MKKLTMPQINLKWVTEWLGSLSIKGFGKLLFIILFFTLIGRVWEAQSWGDRLDKVTEFTEQAVNLQNTEIKFLNSQVTQLKKQIVKLEAQKSLLNSQVLEVRSCRIANVKSPKVVKSIRPSVNSSLW